MKKKFNEWRSKLTCKQKDVVMLVSGVLAGRASYVWFLGAREIANPIIQDLEIVGLTVLIIASFFLSIIGIGQLIVDILEDFEKKRLLKFYKENLSKDEFIEFFFKNVKEGPAGDAGEFYWYMKNCSEPH